MSASETTGSLDSNKDGDDKNAEEAVEPPAENPLVVEEAVDKPEANDNPPKETEEHHEQIIDKVEPVANKDEKPIVKEKGISAEKTNGKVDKPGKKGEKGGKSESDQETDEKENIELKYGAEHVVGLFIPIVLCMSISLFITHIIEGLQPGGRKEPQTALFDSKRGSGTSGSDYGDVAINVAIIMSFLVVATFVVVLCVIKCFKCLIIYLVSVTVLMNLLLEGFLFKATFTALNIPIDFITAVFCIYNYSIATTLSVFWKGPLILEQTFLIINCAAISTWINNIIPAWTVWILLCVLVLWDLFAVLAPCGPLRLLINAVKEKDVPLGQGLVYTAGIIGIEPGTVKKRRAGAGADKEEDHGNKEVEEVESKGPEPQESKGTEPQEPTGEEQDGKKPLTPANKSVTAEAYVEKEDQEESNIKLGLGDFIFYSLLVARASLEAEAVTVIACFVSILVGLGGTLVLLAIWKKALPALPISLVAGVTFYFAGDTVMAPFMNDLAYNQIII